MLHFLELCLCAIEIQRDFETAAFFCSSRFSEFCLLLSSVKFFGFTMAPKHSKETPKAKEAPKGKKAVEKQLQTETAAQALADEAAKKAKKGGFSNMITQLKTQAPKDPNVAQTLELYTGLALKDAEKTKILEKWLQASVYDASMLCV